MSSPRDSQESAPTAPEPPSSLSALQKKTADLEKSNAQLEVRIHKLVAELDAARSQVAWFHRQLFGQKSEHISRDELDVAFRAFLVEQEARTQGASPNTQYPVESELSSIQILLTCFDGGASLQRARALKEAELKGEAQAPSIDEQTPPPPPPPKKKRKGHGRNKIPPTLREETIVIQPDETPENARQVGSEVSYRLGVRSAELVRYAIVRPKYTVDDDRNGLSKTVIAEPPHEMIPRGLFTPSGLAHIIANRHDRSVPYSRMRRFFGDHEYRPSVSTLSGVAIRATPLAQDLLDAMTAHAKEVAPYLAIDATGVRMQQPKACLRGHIWLRYIEDVCVLVSFTETHDSVSAGIQLDGWTCPTVADGAQVFDAKHRETKNDRGGCWSHGRRKFVYAAPTDGRALVGIRWINELFAIERQLVKATPEERLAVRIERASPIIENLFEWRDDLL
ncbi:MAG: transposase, partial [Myxococcota bacterium]